MFGLTSRLTRSPSCCASKGNNAVESRLSASSSNCGSERSNDAVLERPEQADETALDRYIERVLTAKTLDEVFAN